MNQLLQNWLREQADHRPDAAALVMGNRRITYSELEQCTNRLARLLQAAGVSAAGSRLLRHPQAARCHYRYPGNP